MENKPNNSHNRQDKYRQLIIDLIRRKVEKGTGLSLLELKEKYSEESLFRVGLYHVTTTKKAICKALDIPIEAACRYKRRLQKKEHLVESIYDVICPYTKEKAKELSSNPDEFKRLAHTNQTKMF